MRSGRVLALTACLFTGIHKPAWTDEDAVGVDERRLEEGDDGEGPETPAFSGDWRLRTREVYPPGDSYRNAPPSLRHNRYVSARTRVRWGAASAAVLAKRAAVGPALSAGNVREWGTLKAAVAGGIDGDGPSFVLGDYAMSFGQGLLFYDGFGEFVRPARVRERRPRPDVSPSPEEYFRGAALGAPIGPARVDLFYSQKALGLPLNSDGTVDFNWDDFHERSGDVQTSQDLLNHDSVTERLAGARVSGRWGNAHFGVTGARGAFSRFFSPAAASFQDARAFRGRTYTLVSLDGRSTIGEWFIQGEVARSRVPEKPGGSDPFGAAVTAIHQGGVKEWATVFRYDADFISPHGKGPAFAVSGGPESLPRNQKGIQLGLEGKKDFWSGRFNATLAQFEQPRGNGSDGGPLTPSAGHYVLFDQSLSLTPEVVFRLAVSEKGDEQRLDDGSGVYRTAPTLTRRWRGALEWARSSRWTWDFRADEREERVRPFQRLERGRLWSFGGRWRPDPHTTLQGRFYVFDSPKAYLTTGPEEIWDGVVYPRLAGNLGSLRGSPGTRFHVIFKREWGDRLTAWLKWEVTHRPAAEEGRTESSAVPRQAWHLEVAGRWGEK